MSTRTLPSTARRRLARGMLVLAVVATTSSLSACGSDEPQTDDSSTVRAEVVDSETLAPDPGESGSGVVAGPVEVSGTAVGEHPFGDTMADTGAALVDRLGEPTLTVGPMRFHQIDGADGWFETSDDNLSPQWDHRFFAAECWSGFCVLFGGSSRAALTLLGWELADYNRWDADGSTGGVPDPGVRTVEGITLGDSWQDLHVAYPGTSVRGAEGAAVGVDGSPWPTIFDGVDGWRLSGVWDYEHPEKAPPGAAVTRLSAGEGPEPGCC